MVMGFLQPQLFPGRRLEESHGDTRLGLVIDEGEHRHGISAVAGLGIAAVRVEYRTCRIGLQRSPEQISLEPGRIADRSVYVIDTAACEAELELQPVVQ